MEAQAGDGIVHGAGGRHGLTAAVGHAVAHDDGGGRLLHAGVFLGHVGKAGGHVGHAADDFAAGADPADGLGHAGAIPVAEGLGGAVRREKMHGTLIGQVGNLGVHTGHDILGEVHFGSGVQKRAGQHGAGVVNKKIKAGHGGDDFFRRVGHGSDAQRQQCGEYERTQFHVCLQKR